MRKINPDNQYKICIHKNSGYWYASTQPRVFNEKTGKFHCIRKHWGTVDENLKFHPNIDYIYATPEERAKLEFPQDWDLSEIEKLSGNRKKGRKIIDSQDENRLYGDVWLMEKIADDMGLKEDLKRTFGGNEEITNDILTSAMFLISDNRTFSHMAAWQRITKTPSPSPITSSQFTRLTQSISNQNRTDIFRYRMNRLGNDELCAVDSTTRSTYGSSLADIRWGKNKERIPLPQTTEVVIYTLSSHTPIYYRSFPGNIPDSRSLQTILHELEILGFQEIILITDRGYDSIRNLEMLIDTRQPIIMGAKVNQKLISSKLPEIGPGNAKPEGMKLDVATEIFYRQYDLEYKIEGQRGSIKKAVELKLNLYYDVFKRSRDMLNLEILCVEQEERLKELIGQKISNDDEADFKKEFWLYKPTIAPESRILREYELDTKKYEQHIKHAGFFANITQGLYMNAMEANYHYRLRDEQEKYFTKAKSNLGYDRIRTSSEGGKIGRDFILFVAQIILCRIAYVLKTELSDTYSSISEILDEMRSIRYIEHPNTQPHITPFVGRQLEICKAFGFDVPNGCAPDYITRKTNKSKRGKTRPKRELIRDN